MYGDWAIIANLNNGGKSKRAGIGMKQQQRKIVSTMAVVEVHRRSATKHYATIVERLKSVCRVLFLASTDTSVLENWKRSVGTHIEPNKMNETSALEEEEEERKNPTRTLLLLWVCRAAPLNVCTMNRLPFVMLFFIRLDSVLFHEMCRFSFWLKNFRYFFVCCF